MEILWSFSLRTQNDKPGCVHFSHLVLELLQLFTQESYLNSFTQKKSEYYYELIQQWGKPGTTC